MTADAERAMHDRLAGGFSGVVMGGGKVWVVDADLEAGGSDHRRHCCQQHAGEHDIEHKRIGSDKRRHGSYDAFA